MHLKMPSIPGIKTSLLMLLALLGICAVSQAEAAERLVSYGDVEVPVLEYPAEGDRLVLWLPSEHGMLDVYRELATSLQADGIESWIADPYAAYFLPVGPSGLQGIPEGLVAELVDFAHAATDKTIFLVSHDKGAALVLAGVREWQERSSGAGTLGGVVLISPYLLEGTPEVGESARYLPIATATNVPLFVLQPVKSPLYWRLPDLREHLEVGGSAYFLRTLPEVRDRFFFRPDAVDVERDMAGRLPALLVQSIDLLATRAVPRDPAPISSPEPEAAAAAGERELAPYRGDPRPPALALPDLNGAIRELGHEQGKVVLVNFWASWCPPCVHEMPSMQRLSDRLEGRPFTILAANLAERPEDVRSFVEELGLSFTVLLDPRGSAIDDWKVFAYPTSYVIDKQGRIRYALYGAIDWMDPQTVQRIEALVDE